MGKYSCCVIAPLLTRSGYFFFFSSLGRRAGIFSHVFHFPPLTRVRVHTHTQTHTCTCTRAHSRTHVTSLKFLRPLGEMHAAANRRRPDSGGVETRARYTVVGGGGVPFPRVRSHRSHGCSATAA